MWLYPKLKDTCTGNVEIIILFQQVNRQKRIGWFPTGSFPIPLTPYIIEANRSNFFSILVLNYPNQHCMFL